MKKNLIAILAMCLIVTIAVVGYLSTQLITFEQIVCLMVLILTSFFSVYITYVLAKKIGGEEPQTPEDTIEYKFLGYDSTTKVAFLQLHIKEEIVLQPPQQPSYLPFILSPEKPIIEIFEEDIDGMFKIDFKDPAIQIGDIVKKVMRGKQIGLEKVTK